MLYTGNCSVPRGAGTTLQIFTLHFVNRYHAPTRDLASFSDCRYIHSDFLTLSSLGGSISSLGPWWPKPTYQFKHRQRHDSASVSRCGKWPRNRTIITNLHKMLASPSPMRVCPSLDWMYCTEANNKQNRFRFSTAKNEAHRSSWQFCERNSNTCCLIEATLYSSEDRQVSSSLSRIFGCLNLFWQSLDGNAVFF